jgi:hypothetical protein
MSKLSPYRSLPLEQRIALVTHAASASREARGVYIQRLMAKGGGFRAVTLQGWPVDRLAREVVRLKAETGEDEFELLHLLYVQIAPAIQVTFLDAAGVAHDEGRIADDLEVPYADADAVGRAVAAVRAAHGEDGERYLRTLLRYSSAAWPGLETTLAG